MSEPARAGDKVGRLRAALLGLREPIVVVLLLIAFFTALSGKPLDGLLMLMAGAALAWDAGQRAWERSAVTVGGEPVEPGAAPPPIWPPAAAAAPGRGRPLTTLAWVAGSAVYAVVVGSFVRYSWPATVAVVGLGVGVVLLGWQGPVRQRRDPGRLPRRGAAAWGGVLVAGGLWELWALLNQPTLTTSSYDHPTISVLADPVLATPPGRALVLALWIMIGWYLVER